MKNFFLTVIILLIFILSGCGQNIDKERDNCSVPSTIHVQNFTHHKNIHLLIGDIIHKVLGYDSIDVVLLPMNEKLSPFYFAYIEKNKELNNSYFIYVNTYLVSSFYLPTFSHELAHLRQLQSKELVELNDTLYIYKGDTLEIMKFTPPNTRPYEKDAYEEQNLIYELYMERLCECK